MYFYFIDDCGRKKPQRRGMGPLLAVGGFSVNEDSIRKLDNELDSICSQYKFPPGAIFKWSPKKDDWMRDNLKFAQRQEFFISILKKLNDFKVTSWVIIEDTKYKTATGANRPDLDLTQLFLERAHFELRGQKVNGTIIISQPSGDRESEYEFLAGCIEILKQGTLCSKLDKIVQILCLNHRYSRLLQAADIIASCTTAYVSGENQYSPPIFEYIKPTLAKDLNRIGGVGLKIHPDNKYVNLYHWSLGDATFWKGSSGFPLPFKNFDYETDPDKP